MARLTKTVALLIVTSVLTIAPRAALAQRPALASERARVAERVRRDLSRLAQQQRSHHEQTKAYASDLKSLSFTPSSGAEINIAFASAGAWAGNASHAMLVPLKCFVIVSVADAANAPTGEPFCTEAEPGTAAGRVAASAAVASAAPAPSEPAQAAPTQPTQQTPSKSAPATPSKSAPATSSQPAQTTPSQPAPATPSQPAPATPSKAAPATPSKAAPATPSKAAPATPSKAAQTTPNQPARPSVVSRPRTPPRTPPARPSNVAPSGGPAREVPGAARLSTREVIAGAATSERVEATNAAQFADFLEGFAQSALTVLNTVPPETVRDPYESTSEFEQRRAQALAEHQRRETEFFRTNTRTYSVQLPVRDVKYDADREVVEFVVDDVRLPVMRQGPNGGQLSLTCYTRPVFWCSPEGGMRYDAGDLWRIPRATARQFDVLRTPMTLTARYTVGRLEGERALAVSLVDMELQARGQSVQRWPTR